MRGRARDPLPRSSPRARRGRSAARPIPARRALFRDRLRRRSCRFLPQAVAEAILPEAEVALFDREAARAAHVKLKPRFPGHPDTAVNLDDNPPRRTIAIRRTTCRARGVQSE